MGSQVDTNYDAFLKELPQLIVMNRDKFALLQDGKVESVYSTWEDAYRTGERFFGTGNYSIQKITDTQVDLGFFSHAVHIR